MMTENELELIKIIRENDNPEEAVKVFAAIIELLKQHEASAEQASACHQTNYQMSR